MINNNYFYINEAEQFTFYRIPKTLFTNEKYKKMSTDAKVLYGLLLDRVGLSIKNNWIDDLQRVYIIFTREEAQDYLNIKSDKTITKLFKELNTYGLIEEIRQGLNKPNIIYVKKFIENIDNTRNSKKYGSGTVKNTVQEIQNLRANDTDNNDTDNNDIYKSVSQLKSTTIAEEQNRQTDHKQIEVEKETIVASAEVNLYQGEHRQLLENTIVKLLELKQIQVQNKVLNRENIREQLHKLNINIIDFTFAKFRQAQAEQIIKNKARYFMVLLLNCIEEYSANSIV